MAGCASDDETLAERPGKSEQEGIMKRCVVRFWQDESGATAIEYCLIAASIALAIIVIISGLGSTLADKLTSLNTSLK